MTIDSLVDDLLAARGQLLDATSQVASDSVLTPGLIGEWSARELIAHLGYWSGHAAELIHATEGGLGDRDCADGPAVDEINETVARIARGTDLATVRRREAASVEALVERLRALDPALLAARLADGATLEEGIREDGPLHYREHAEELLRILDARSSG